MDLNLDLKTASEICQDIAAAAKERRIALNLTQAELSRRSGVAIATLKRFDLHTFCSRFPHFAFKVPKFEKSASKRIHSWCPKTIGLPTDTDRSKLANLPTKGDQDEHDA